LTDDARLRLEPLGQRLAWCHLPVGAQRQRLEPLQVQPGVLGASAAPRSRSPSTRARIAKATLPKGPPLPNTSQKFRPPYEGSGR
jgi:hypothetical protein